MTKADIDKLIAKIKEQLLHGEWMTFAELARIITGDRNDAALIEAGVDARPGEFAVQKNKGRGLRVKLLPKAAPAPSPSGPSLPEETKSTTSPVDPQVDPKEAERAVRAYAKQLHAVRVDAQHIGPGRPVLERFVHAITIDAADGDMRFPDDMPVELVCASGSKNPGTLVATSVDESVLHVALR